VILAGEASGDAHAARVLRALKQQVPELTAEGFGGPELRAEGMICHEDIRDLAVMGFWEVMKRYGMFRRIFHERVNDLKSNPPDLVLLVDYPGFNLRLAKALQGTGIPVVQYICPQVWAWKSSRIPMMARVLDRVLCIFPFEPEVFKDVNLDVRYCGHPMVDETREVEPDPGWSGPGPKIALVPGSRVQEIERLFLPMLETASHFPDAQFRVPVANSECRACMIGILEQHPELPKPELVEGRMRPLVKGADAALVTSGTATLETALLGTPMLILYKTSTLTYELGRRLVKVPFIGMVNLVAGREVCPEFIQKDADPETMAARLQPLLIDSPERADMLRGLEEVRQVLKSDRHGEAVAGNLLDLMQRTD
jgi:lipid-A-disaccharide synthase